MNGIRGILDQVWIGKRLTPEQGVWLLESRDLAALAEAADQRTQQFHPHRYRTYHIDRNINYTNVCISGCQFCAFSRRPGDRHGWVIDRESLFQKIEETISLGGDQILLQGGLHPDLPLSWYEDLLQSIRSRFPKVNIHGFSPPEIVHLAQISKLPVREVLLRLKEAGLGSLPGGGAEILVDRVRKQLSPSKCTSDEWLDVCRTWYQMGGRGSATMMFGHLETLADRIEHLQRLRQLQDETGGVTAFIPWTFQPSNTALAHLPKTGVFDYLRTLAVSRLYLDNFPNIQASWVTQGLKIAQMALRFGANDLGSLMIEENVVAAAGTRFRASLEEIRRTIRSAGFIPRQRNVFYQWVDEPEQDGSDRLCKTASCS